jgi:hypothetical protein
LKQNATFWPCPYLFAKQILPQQTETTYATIFGSTPMPDSIEPHHAFEQHVPFQKKKLGLSRVFLALVVITKNKAIILVIWYPFYY